MAVLKSSIFLFVLNSFPIEDGFGKVMEDKKGEYKRKKKKKLGKERGKKVIISLFLNYFLRHALYTKNMSST